MARELDTAEVRRMFVAVCDAMLASIDRLTEADQVIGDGDHGVGMRRGFAAARDALDKNPPPTVADTFKAVGSAVMAASGGASGAIFGTLFRAGAPAVGDAATLDGARFAAFLDQGLAAVMKRGGAAPGGKTMLDALAPAARAAGANAADLTAASAAAAEAALAGVEATKSMIATTGKARTLGERSLGHADPGAISMSIVLAAMAAFIAAPARSD